MQTKEALRNLYLKISEANSVSDLMRQFEIAEQEHGITATFLFVSDTPLDAENPQYLSLVDEDGEEWSNPTVNRVAAAFSIRADMTYGHRDLKRAYAEWFDPSSKHLKAFNRTVQDNDTDADNADILLDAMTRVVPSLVVIK